MQLREKTATTREFLEEARALKAILAPHGVPLVINDRVDIALAVGAGSVGADSAVTAIVASAPFAAGLSCAACADAPHGAGPVLR